MRSARTQPQAGTSMISKIGAPELDTDEIAAIFQNPGLAPLGAQEGAIPEFHMQARKVRQ